MTDCNEKCEVFSRVTGYYRPTKNWNEGKTEEFKFRKTFSENKALKNEFHLNTKELKSNIACSKC